MRHIITESDAGAVRVGRDGFYVMINNKYGDGYTHVFILDENERDEVPKDATFECCIGAEKEYGGTHLYEYDCRSESIVATLVGRYGVYTAPKRVYFQKWSEA